MTHICRSVPVLLLFLLSTSLLLAQNTERPTPDVMDTLKPDVEQALSIFNNKDLSYSEKRTRIEDIVDELFQYRLMGKLVLGREHWSKMSELQKQRYVELFAQKMKISYVRKLIGIDEVGMQFGKPNHTGTNKVYVPAVLQLPGDDIDVEYRLFRSEDNGAWKVYDIMLGDVSMVKSYRSQYCGFLDGNTIGALLKRMAQKVQELRKLDV